MNCPPGAAGAYQPAPAQHAEVPAEPGLTYPQRIRQLLDRYLMDAGKELQDPKPRQAGERLVMSAELTQGGR
jgi:hypothetical protein